MENVKYLSKYKNDDDIHKTPINTQLETVKINKKFQNFVWTNIKISKFHF